MRRMTPDVRGRQFYVQPRVQANGEAVRHYLAVLPGQRTEVSIEYTRPAFLVSPETYEACHPGPLIPVATWHDRQLLNQRWPHSCSRIVAWHIAYLLQRAMCPSRCWA
jgi:hypothetical protein